MPSESKKGRLGITQIALLFMLFLPATGFGQTASAETTSNTAFGTEVAQFGDGQIIARNPKTRFDCGDRIYGVFRIENLPQGQHQIQTRWISPSGKVERVNSRLIIIEKPGRAVFMSSSIEFRSNQRLLAVFDPAAGLETYIGKWNAETMVAGKTIGTGSFSVLC